DHAYLLRPLHQLRDVVLALLGALGQFGELLYQPARIEAVNAGIDFVDASLLRACIRPLHDAHLTIPPDDATKLLRVVHLGCKQAGLSASLAVLRCEGAQACSLD